MAAKNVAAAGCLWFPQIDAERTINGGNVLSRAVRAYCRTFEIETTSGIVGNPLVTTFPTLFDLPLLLKSLSAYRTPLYVFGTLTAERIIECSWDELGLNLFDLPWFSPAEDKAFKYVSLLTLPKHHDELRRLFANDGSPDIATACQKAAEHLRWGLCHKLSNEIQRSVGHGVRDRLQLKSEIWENTCKSLRDVVDDQKWSGLPCGDVCGIRARAAQLLAQSDEGDEQKRLSLSRHLAALGCRSYRYASATYFTPELTLDGPKFDRIIILDDNPAFRAELKAAVSQFLAPDAKRPTADRITEADPKKSWELYQLADAQGRSIIQRYKDEGVDAKRILACFDLDLSRENAPQGPGDALADVFGGQWIMYGTASAFADVPRMVVTGFRSQDLLGFAAGGGAYLLKPFTEESLREQVSRAAITWRVKWLCPSAVQDDYCKELGGRATFNQYAGWLTRWLREERVEVEVIEEIISGKIAESDLVLVDMCRANDGSWASDPLSAILDIRHINARVPLLLTIPAGDGTQDNTANYYRSLPITLRNGTDAIIKKPMWIVADGRHDSDDALSAAILKQLKRLNDYDVKYQILVPVVGVVGRFDAGFIKRVLADTPGGNEDILCAPLLPYLIEVYGLSGRVDVVESDTNLASMEEKLKAEPKQDHDRWGGPGNTASAESSIIEALPRIRAALRSNAVKEHRSFEVWLRRVIEEKTRSAFGAVDIHSLTEPLTRVFGGATRYEFSARGSWYRNIEQRIDDMLIVVEFCAKSSIIAKRFIEITVVNYLLKVAGEYCVMVQEIPIRGYLKG